MNLGFITQQVALWCVLHTKQVSYSAAGALMEAINFPQQVLPQTTSLLGRPS